METAPCQAKVAGGDEDGSPGGLGLRMGPRPWGLPSALGSMVEDRVGMRESGGEAGWGHVKML